MDNTGNRLYLNFGNSGDRLQANDRTAYPTTPSTFPQPVFPGAPGQPQNAAGGGQSSQQQQPYANGGYAPQGYFMQNQYAAAQFQTSVQDYGAPAGQNQPAAYGQARSNTPGTNNDPNTGLAHQFSHQNLGGAARGAPYAPRGPSPAQRPRTAGAPAQQSSYSSYLNPPVPTQPSPRVEFQQAPERNSDKYGPNAHNNQKKCSQLAADFFKDSVKRARERNQR
jgi:protein-serine/threonine kinase